MAADYAGDKSPKETWDALAKDPKAQLVDVRSDAEFTWVGVPDLAKLGKKPVCIPWKFYAPKAAPNEKFVDQVKASLPDTDAPIFFICRSGGRSRDAAKAMTAAGYKRCYNVATGFEGDLDAGKHRGSTGGWRHDGLPWAQS